jgi:hypothetical protein
MCHTSMLTDCFLVAVANTLLKAQLVLASHTQLEHQITTILVTGAPKQMHILFSSIGLRGSQSIRATISI